MLKIFNSPSEKRFRVLMSEGVNILKWIRRFIKEDLGTIATFLFVILLIVSGFVMMMGFLGIGSADFRTPSINPVNKSGLADSDSDSLPDIIEGTNDRPCNRGDPVRDQQDESILGYCTETDPNDIDSDNDGFTDAVEDAVGTDPTNFFSPGFIYIIMAIYIGVFTFFYYYRGDPLKEYKEFEMKASSGVSGPGSKFAYGGSSVFGDKPASEVSEEERAAAVAADPRVQRMIAEEGAPTKKFKKKRNWGVLAIQLAIAALFAIFIFIAARNS